MSKYSNQEIASNYTLWMEFVDPDGIDTESAFNAMSIERKISIIEDCFPESKSKAAKALRSVNSPAQQSAARENGRKGGRPKKGRYSATFHRDGTVTYWSVYLQQWVRSSSMSDEEIAAQGDDRARIIRHLGL